MMLKLEIPYFLALDVDHESDALSLVSKTKKYVGGFKLGPRLTYKYGSQLVSKISRHRPVFVDNKYHDIPSTVVAALKASHQSGASYATVHASNGPECLKQLHELELGLNNKRSFQILAVTVLTSFHQNNMPKNWLNKSPASHVSLLTSQVKSSGIRGVVCSPAEVKAVKKMYPRSQVVVPGIRMPDDDPGDQARVATPADAFRSGAFALVIGRTILDASDPARKAQEVCEHLRSIDLGARK